MNKDVNQLKNYLNSLINESQSKGDQYGDLVDFWVYIFGDSEFYNTGYYSEFSKGGAYDFESHPKMTQQGEQGKSNMGFKTNFHANSKKLFSYKYLEKIMSHKKVDIGNPEIGENFFGFKSSETPRELNEYRELKLLLEEVEDLQVLKCTRVSLEQ